MSDPGPLTLRELAVMAESRQEAEWAHTAAMLAQIANVGGYLFAKRPRAYAPREFNPTARRKTIKPNAKHKLTMMAFMFTDAKL